MGKMNKSCVCRCNIIRLCMMMALWFAVADCHALDGAWRGELTLNSVKLPIVLNFVPADNGGVGVTLDSPAQGVKGLAVDVVFCSDDSVALDIKSIGASYRGVIAGSEIKGRFTQRGYSFPLMLSPELPVSDRRPQTPRPPFPYQSVDTVFYSEDGVRLTGTITLPDNPAAGNPAVVMVTGSGPQNRDEELFEHRPFAVLADYLARNGVASLRYDDRGTAASQGDFATADIDTFKDDAKAAVTFLRGIEGVGRVGVLGHSEGGTIAFMLGAEGIPDFVISLAGATCRGKDLILAQNQLSLDKMQSSDKQRSDGMQLLSLVFDDIIAGKSYADIPVEAYVRENGLDVNPLILMSLRRSITSAPGDYFRKLISLDPSEWLGNVRCKVIALNGSLDTQVSSKANLDVVRNALPAAIVKEYPGLNHLFQHALTGEISEYAGIAETISPEVLSDITDFINGF